MVYLALTKNRLQSAQSEIKTALAGKPNTTVYSYPGQRHAFARHNGTHYNAAAAALANGRTHDFLHRANDVTVSLVPDAAPYSLTMLWRIKALIREYRPDIVQTNSIKSHYLVSLLRRREFMSHCTKKRTIKKLGVRFDELQADALLANGGRQSSGLGCGLDCLRMLLND